MSFVKAKFKQHGASHPYSREGEEAFVVVVIAIVEVVLLSRLVYPTERVLQYPSQHREKEHGTQIEISTR